MAGLGGVLAADAVGSVEGLPALAAVLRSTELSPPEAVVRPAGVAEVARLMQWASREDVGVLPVASGTRARTALEVPAGRKGRWIALCTERLAGIEIYEPADLTLTAGASTRLDAVARALEENGQFAAFDPPAMPERSLGGLVADGGSGPLWTGYGELRNHVLGATVVTGDGRVLRLGGRVVKNVAGFDLLKPMTGSRGSLGVITSVCVRAFPRPAQDRLLVLEGRTVGELLDLAVAVGTAPVLPVSVVVLAPEARLVVRLHGAPPTVDSDQRTVEEHVGVRFETHEARDADDLVRHARDHAADGSVVIEASARPSRLASLWAAVEAAAPAGAAIDTYAGRVRAAFASLAPGEIASLARSAEAEAGALRVLRAPDPAAASAGTGASDVQRKLTQDLRKAFDPRGVMWPARR